MPAFIVATVNISDPQIFAEYGKAIAGLSESFGGEPILRGAVTELLEGAGTPGERVVVTRDSTSSDSTRPRLRRKAQPCLAAMSASDPTG